MSFKKGFYYLEVCLRQAQAAGSKVLLAELVEAMFLK